MLQSQSTINEKDQQPASPSSHNNNIRVIGSWLDDGSNSRVSDEEEEDSQPMINSHAISHV